MDDNRQELLAPDMSLAATLVEPMYVAQSAACTALSDELGERAAQGHIVDGHGDLRPEHIYVGSPPCIIDALEFSADLRAVDPAEELAYLAVECEYAGNAPIGQRFIDSYRDQSSDGCSQRLFDFYRSQRAATRAKIVLRHLCDPQYRWRQPWPALATRYVLLATRHALEAVRSAGPAHVVER